MRAGSADDHGAPKSCATLRHVGVKIDLPHQRPYGLAMKRRRFVVTSVAAAVAGPVISAAQSSYKAEFNMSLVIAEDTPWGRAANRFASAMRYRTQGRITVKNHFDGRLFAGKQTTEFTLLQQGIADFAMGSTINWSAQVKELNLFALPFMFPSYKALDAVLAGAAGNRLFRKIEDKGVVPIAWGENGFRELTNSKRAVRRPEDLQGLKVRIVGVPIFIEIFQALGASPVSMNWNEALVAFREGTVDGQENPVWLIIPYRIWANHKHVTLWHYAIDPLVLAVSARRIGTSCERPARRSWPSRRRRHVRDSTRARRSSTPSRGSTEWKRLTSCRSISRRSGTRHAVSTRSGPRKSASTWCALRRRRQTPQSSG